MTRSLKYASDLVEEELAGSILVSIEFLESLNALIEGAEVHSLSHMHGCSEEFLLVVNATGLWLDNHLDLNKELLSKRVTLGTTEAKINFAYIKARAIIMQGFELWSNLNGHI